MMKKSLMVLWVTLLFAVPVIFGTPRRPRTVVPPSTKDPMAPPIGFEANRTPLNWETKYSQKEKDCFNNQTVLFDGTCEKLLEKGKCIDGMWLVLDLLYAPGVKPICKKRRCDSDHVFWSPKEMCLPIVNQIVCTKLGTGLYADSYGFGVCSCKRDKAREMHVNGVCYPLYSRGPCSRDSIFVAAASVSGEGWNKNGGGICIPDPCYRHNQGREVIYLHWEVTGKCYKADSKGPCDGDKIFTVDPWLKKPWCSDGLNYWYLVDIPKNCPMDHSGNCVEGTKLQPPGQDYLAALLAAGEKRLVNRGG